MNKILPERQLTILDHLDEMSKKLNTFHQCTVYDDFLEDLKYVKELVKRDIGLPMSTDIDRHAHTIGICPKCHVGFWDVINTNYCHHCGQALYHCGQALYEVET